MKLFFTKLFLCCCFIFFTISCIAQTKFYATASPAKAGIDEYITYTLTIENGRDIKIVNQLAFKDFIVVSGPTQLNSEGEKDGLPYNYITLTYLLQPRRTGRFSINFWQANIDGKNYKTAKVDVSVSKSSQLQNIVFDAFDGQKPAKEFDDYKIQKGDSILDKVKKNIQLRLQIDKTSCYIGEAIFATYKLYTRLRTESDMAKNPSFNGFSVVDMMMPMEQNTSNLEVLNGREYNAYTLRKAQLYPLQAGTIELESASIDNKVTLVKLENGDSVKFEETLTLSSMPLTVKVKPLPEKGKPENFKDAVGNFEIDAVVEKNNFSTDETGKLLITISGKGNMQLLTTPEIAWPKGFEVFETKITDNTNNATIPISGSKTFEFPFTVADSGKYIIPSIKFSFFDPTNGTYKTISTSEIILNVFKSNVKPLATIANIKKEKPVSELNKIFLNRWAVILLLAGIIIIAVLFWLRKEKRKEEELAIEKQKKEKEVNITPVSLSSYINYLEKTENCLFKNDCLDFYILLNTELKQFLANRFLVEKEKINSRSLITIMDKQNIDNNIGLQTQQLMQEIEWQLYTPFERSEKLNEMYASAQTIIQLLNKPFIYSVNL
jgi:BatD DUF11 like domain